MERAEAAAGEPLAHLLLEAPAEDLARTRAAQLSVLLASLLAWDAVRDGLPQPVAFAGHSLGQVTALVAAGAVGLDDGVRLALARADATQVAADATQGRMAAMVGAGLDEVETACGAAPGACWVANDNAPGQVVVGGTPDGLEAATDRASECGVRRVMVLDVGGAFHTPLMEPARDALTPALAATPFTRPDIPVVANTDAAPYDDDAWAPRLAAHLVGRVRWRESLLELQRLGATTLVEVGPGTTLNGLARRTVPDLDAHSVATPDDVAALPVGVHQ